KRSLLTWKVDLSLQQEPDFGKRLSQTRQMDRTCPMFAGEEAGELLEDFHVLRVAARNIWLQDFEHTPFASLILRVSPSETHHRADSRLRQNRVINFHFVGPDLVLQFAKDDAADFVYAYVGDPVL